MRTPLWSHHRDLGATFTDFAGFEMPVYYGSINDEHLAVRSRVGLFDVSHMSNVWVRGPQSAQAIARVTPSDPEAVPEGKGKYTVFLRQDGTILDDAFYFRTGPEEFFVIPNAGMAEAVVNHIALDSGAKIEDVSSQWAILALQGPAARGVLKEATSDVAPKFHHINPMTIAGISCLVSGTGYTGEKGVELYVPAAGAPAVWTHLLSTGATEITPIGLGARDTLRLEKGYCLAGHEFKGGRTPLEAGLDWLINWDVAFIGRDALLAQKDTNYPHLRGLVLERGVAREGYPLHRAGATPKIGAITSGTMSPTLKKGIALAYLDQDCEEIEVDVRGRRLRAQRADPPFV